MTNKQITKLAAKAINDKLTMGQFLRNLWHVTRCGDRKVYVVIADSKYSAVTQGQDTYGPVWDIDQDFTKDELQIYSKAYDALRRQLCAS
jgi:hypothetical protein